MGCVRGGCQVSHPSPRYARHLPSFCLALSCARQKESPSSRPSPPISEYALGGWRVNNPGMEGLLRSARDPPSRSFPFAKHCTPHLGKASLCPQVSEGTHRLLTPPTVYIHEAPQAISLKLCRLTLCHPQQALLCPRVDVKARPLVLANTHVIWEQMGASGLFPDISVHSKSCK